MTSGPMFRVHDDGGPAAEVPRLGRPSPYREVVARIRELEVGQAVEVEVVRGSRRDRANLLRWVRRIRGRAAIPQFTVGVSESGSIVVRRTQ